MMAELSNPILQATEDKVESGLTPENKQNYLRVVVAGQNAALDKGPDGILASLRQSKDPVADAARGAISLVLILRKDAKGIMPLKALVPAGMTFLLKALDFADRAGIVKVGEPELIRATNIYKDTILARFGITNAGLQNAATRIHAITQDPEAMAKVNLAAGITRHPNAAQPTPLPPSGGMMNGGGT